MSVIECNVLCYDQVSEDMGLKTKDEWIPFSIRVDQVAAVKLNGMGDNANKGVIYSTYGEVYVVDVEYETLKFLWYEAMGYSKILKSKL